MSPDQSASDAADEMLMFDERLPAPAAPVVETGAVWRVLIVDDDSDVHQATSLALKGFRAFGRPVVLLHAHGAAEGMEALQSEPEVAVAFIDVIMEQKDSGLRLVEAIRQKGFSEIRLVLRTGQPGNAPELSVITEHDINDYRTKAELTRPRLLSVLTAAIRSYSQVRQINESRAGLQMIVTASADLFNRRNLGLFSRGVLTQVAAIMGVPVSGLVCVAPRLDGGKPAAENLLVVSDAGRFADSIGRSLAEVSNDRVARAFELAAGAADPVVADGEVAMLFHCSQGRQLFVYLDSAVVPSEANLGLLKVFAANIAISFENVDLVERLDTLAFVDPAIEGPNANAFRTALNDLLQTSRDDLVVVAISLEELDSATATFGSNLTNLALKSFYEELQRLVPEAYSIARTSHHIFSIAVARTHLDLESLYAALLRPVVVGDVTLLLQSTIAVVGISDAMADAQTVLRHAVSTILHAGRAQLRGINHYHRSISDNVRERTTLQSALHEALETGESIVTNLQPKVDLRDGRIVGAEALARWAFAGQPVSPATFIPIAEASGLSGAITWSVIRSVGRWAQERAAAGLPPLPVAVNLSMYDINEEGFVGRLLARVADAGLTHETLQFEITESGMMRDPGRAIEMLRRIKEAGFEIAIDDFGTGYSSLAYLERLPVDVLKIDRSFVVSLSLDTARQSIAAMSLAMARSLKFGVVAEGIETLEQHQTLLFLGCPVGQGYLYGRPVAIDRFNDTFQDWSLAQLPMPGGGG